MLKTKENKKFMPSPATHCEARVNNNIKAPVKRKKTNIGQRAAHADFLVLVPGGYKYP